MLSRQGICTQERAKGLWLGLSGPGLLVCNKEHSWSVRLILKSFVTRLLKHLLSSSEKDGSKIKWMSLPELSWGRAGSSLRRCGDWAGLAAVRACALAELQADTGSAGAPTDSAAPQPRPYTCAGQAPLYTWGQGHGPATLKGRQYTASDKNSSRANRQ